MDSKTPPCLITCPDLMKYADMVECVGMGGRTIPILRGPRLPYGFPPGTTSVPAPEARSIPHRSAAIVPAVGGQILALAEPHCTAAARLLANTSGRSFVGSDAARWERRLDDILDDGVPPSLTFVVPGWNEEGRPDPTWIRRTLASARSRHRRLRDVPWGIITGATPHTLTLLVAKSLLQADIAVAYSACPSLLFTMDRAADLGVDLPTARPEEASPLQLLDKTRAGNGGTAWIAERAWSFIYFHGHGRSYCACGGHLCAARTINVAPEAPATCCIDGMDCANPKDHVLGPDIPAFPRIDPRRYDTPVMLMACCSGGGWYDDDWKGGYSSVALLALAGHPSAVVTSDYTTLEVPGGYMQKLFAFSQAASVGRAVSIINSHRESSGGSFPYYLLGDPECPTGSARWPRWAVQAPVLELPSTAPMVWRGQLQASSTGAFCTARLPPFAGSSAIFLELPDGEARIQNAFHFAGETSSELWVRIEECNDPEQSARILVERRPAPTLPAHLQAVTETVPLQTQSWSSEMNSAAAILLESVNELATTGQILDELARRPTFIPFRQVEDLISECREDWMEAQRQCVGQVLRLADKGLWPFRLWSQSDCQAFMVEDACPHCLAASTLLRVYVSPPAQKRRQRECVNCALIEDRPISPLPTVALRAPSRMKAGEVSEIEVALNNPLTQPNQTFAIAGAVLLDQRGHGAETPPPFALELLPGHSHIQKITICLERNVPIRHRYYLRCLLLVNGSWMMAGRIVTVS